MTLGNRLQLPRCHKLLKNARISGEVWLCKAVNLLGSCCADHKKQTVQGSQNTASCMVCSVSRCSCCTGYSQGALAFLPALHLDNTQQLPCFHVDDEQKVTRSQPLVKAVGPKLLAQGISLFDECLNGIGTACIPGYEPLVS